MILPTRRGTIEAAWLGALLAVPASLDLLAGEVDVIFWIFAGGFVVLLGVSLGLQIRVGLRALRRGSSVTRAVGLVTLAYWMSAATVMVVARLIQVQDLGRLTGDIALLWCGAAVAGLVVVLVIVVVRGLYASSPETELSAKP